MHHTMKHFLFPLVGLFAFSSSQGQIALNSGSISPGIAALSNTNSISVTQHQPLVFSYQSIDEYDMDKTITNALSVELAPRQANQFIYCQVVFNGPPQPQLAQRLGLKLRNPVQVPYSGDFDHIVMLSTTPVKIAEVSKQSPGSLHYDVLLRKQTKMESTGNFNYTLVFSIIQP